MANWCSTSYAICSENKELLQTICNAINECAHMKEPLTPKSSPNWAGNVFKKLGIDAKADRTFWEEASIEDSVLKFSESSAWSRGSAIITLQDHYLDDENGDELLNIYFVSEESGQGIYETNDEAGDFFPERYRFWGEEEGDEYYDTFDELKKDVQELLGVDTDFKSIEEMSRALSDAEDEIGEYSIYEIEFTNL